MDFIKKLLSTLKGGVLIAAIVLLLFAINAAGALIPGVSDDWLWRFLRSQILSLVRSFLPIIVLAAIVLILIKSQAARDAVMGFVQDNPKAALIIGGTLAAIVVLFLVWEPLCGFLAEWWISILIALIVGGGVIAAREMGYL